MQENFEIPSDRHLQAKTIQDRLLAAGDASHNKHHASPFLSINFIDYQSSR
jgi:hypothetical protein